MSDFAKHMGLAVVVTGLLFGGVSLHLSKVRADRLANGEGELKSLVPASAGGKPLWVSLETQEFSDEDSNETVWRISVYELETGKRVARKAEVPWTSCAPAQEGALWCVVNDGVELVSLPTLEVLRSAAAIQAKVGQKMMEASQLRVTPNGALRTLLADGRSVEVQPETLELRPANPQAPSPSTREYERTSPFYGLSACSLPNSGRSGLCIGYADRKDSGEGYLRPDLLVLPELKDRLLLLAKTSLDSAVSAAELWVLDEQLKPVTHRVLVPKEPVLMKLHWLPKTRTVVLGFGPFASTTVAVDVDTGAERYRIRH